MFTAGTSSHHVPWELHAELLKAEVRRSQPVASLSPRWIQRDRRLLVSLPFWLESSLGSNDRIVLLSVPAAQSGLIVMLAHAACH